IQRPIATASDATRWHFVVHNLNIHRSESLVRFVAAHSGLEIDLGIKYKSGILKSRATRSAFLSDRESSHRLPLLSQTRLLDEPGGAVSVDSGPKAAPPRLVHLGGGPGRQSQ